MIRSYETMVVYDGALTEDDARKEADGFEALLKEKCDVKKVDTWGRRKLAYEIKGKTAGYYVLFFYDAESGMPAEIDRRFKLDEKVLRYLTVVGGPSSAAQAAQPEDEVEQEAQPQKTAEAESVEKPEKAAEPREDKGAAESEEPEAEGESDDQTAKEDAESAQA
ncbi:MAG: 30S ribosomal protein S6 [Chitinivibrionales bacterium]|nr:30S ribosomal protein S6 [Chitinivibrionales bacterium]